MCGRGEGENRLRRACRKGETSGRVMIAAQVTNRTQLLGPRFGEAEDDTGKVMVSRRVNAVQRRTLWCEG
jgi:hypothetical protein